MIQPDVLIYQHPSINIDKLTWFGNLSLKASRRRQCEDLNIEELEDRKC